MDNAVIDLKLTVAQINVILNSLARGAYIEVQPIVDEIRAQAAPQLSQLQQSAAEQES